MIVMNFAKECEDASRLYATRAGSQHGDTAKETMTVRFGDDDLNI